MDGLVLARVLHVLAVVVWIGGVTMVTTVVLPAARRGSLGVNRLAAFQAIERRFVWQARAAIVIVGASGFYMTSQADLWDRFRTTEFWWMHAMVGVWALFAIGLFVIEPFVIDRHFEKWANTDPLRAFAWLQRAHWLLLVLSLITVCGAVAGSQGWSMF